MIRFALALGYFPLVIFLLGIFHLFYPSILIATTIIFWGGFLFGQIKIFAKPSYSLFIKEIISSSFPLLLSTIFLLLVISSFIGVLTPELGFDALWYHLMLPKLYLVNHYILHIPGPLLYYSDMPKLAEMYYTVALVVGDTRSAKFIHFLFGLITTGVLISFSRRFLSRTDALLVGIVFYSNLLVLWESSSAYIDLIWTFFELMTLILFLEGIKTGEKKTIILSSIFMGFSLSTKLLAFRSLGIYLFLLAKEYVIERKIALRTISSYLFGALLISFPHFLFALIYTGNPFYPLFSSHFSSLSSEVLSLSLLNPYRIFETFWITFTKAADPLSPVYLISLPLLFIYYQKMSKELQLLSQYCILGYLAWYITSIVEGARIFLPYLPALSVLTVYSLRRFIEDCQDKRVTRIIGSIVAISILLPLFYRIGVVSKVLPVVLGKESQEQYLIKKLNYSFGDFYDIDGYFKKTIKPSDNVLLYGFHNMYYVDFNFTHESWAKKGNSFTYIATQHTDIPKRFAGGQLIYHNAITGVSLYTRKEPWIY